jgi:hypothetical protein
MYSYPDIIRGIKSRRMRWTGYVTHMEKESVHGFGGKARKKEFTWKTKV